MVSSFCNPQKCERSDSMSAGHLRLQTVWPQASLDAIALPPRALPLTTAHVEVLAIPIQPTNTRAIPALACPCLPFSTSTRTACRNPRLTAYTVQPIPQTWSYSPTRSIRDRSPIPTPLVRWVDFSSCPQVLPTSILGRRARSGSSSRVALQVSFRSAC